MQLRLRLPRILAIALVRINLLLETLGIKYKRNTFDASRLQTSFDEIFRRQLESTTWQSLCKQVFDSYVGQFGFATVGHVGLLVEHLGVTSQSRVLELAPGTGGLSVYLAELTGCRLVGVDASPFAVKAANMRVEQSGLVERVHFEVGILPKLSYKDCSFDVVTCIDSLKQVPNTLTMFRECYRVLRPGGCVGFLTLCRRRNFELRNPVQRVAYNWFPPQSYPELLKQAGFQGIAEVDLTEGFIRFTKHWVDAMEENKKSLKRELGDPNIWQQDQVTALALAKEGYVGWALFKAKKT